MPRINQLDLSSPKPDDFLVFDSEEGTRKVQVKNLHTGDGGGVTINLDGASASEKPIPIKADILGVETSEQDVKDKVDKDDVLTYEEIQIADDQGLAGKLPDAKSVKTISQNLQNNYIKAKSITVTKTVAENTDVEFNLSSYFVGHNVVGAIVSAGDYPIPYVNSSKVLTTWVRTISQDGKITIINKDTAWNNYGWRFVIFYV